MIFFSFLLGYFLYWLSSKVDEESNHYLVVTQNHARQRTTIKNKEILILKILGLILMTAGIILSLLYKVNGLF